jgi:beta-galactosidase
LTYADGALRLRNAYDFSGLGHLRGQWVLEASDGTSSSVPAQLPDLGPGCTVTVDIPRELAEAGAGERWLQLVVTQAEGTAWNPAGAEVSRPCVRLPDRDRTPAGEAAPVAVDVTGVVEFPGLARPELTLWREPTDNDAIAGDGGRWVAAGLRDAQPAVVVVDGSSVTSVLKTTAGEVRHVQRFTRGEDGLRVEDTVELPEGLEDVPRVGVRIPLAGRATGARWFGTGPWETYPDRCTAPVGWHELPVADLAVPYVRPQENGARTHVRELAVTTTAGVLRFSFDQPVTVTVHPDAVVVDVAHRGLGTASCGPNALPPYRVATGTHRWSWSVQSSELA